MEVFDFFEEVNIPKGTALCLGNFDGVHLGHRRLFDAAKEHGKWGVLVFDGNFKGDKLLTTLSEKLEIIEKSGADYVITAKPTESFLNMTGEEFYRILKTRIGVGMLVAGYDYRFGKGAYHSVNDLAEWAEKDGIKTHIEEEYIIGSLPVKSSRIRDYIKKGELSLAKSLLGYNYSLSGKVVRGLENGHKMGFPTANVEFDKEKLLPTDGVYKGKIEIDKISYSAVINIGKNPTFDAAKRTLEVHIPGFDKDIYGEFVKVEITEKIRGEIHFDSVDELVEQIKKDVECALDVGEKERKKSKDIW